MILQGCFHHLSDGSSLRTKAKTLLISEPTGTSCPHSCSSFSQSFTVLQVLISGLIPSFCVYSGRLKSSHPSLLSPNLQHNPLELKPLPCGKARATRDGGGIGAGDWTRALFYLRGLESTSNQGGHEHITSRPTAWTRLSRTLI